MSQYMEIKERYSTWTEKTLLDGFGPWEFCESVDLRFRFFKESEMSKIILGPGFEYEGEPTWNFSDPRYVHWDTLQHSALTHQCGHDWPMDSLNSFRAGPGFPISPTRTPWASWWRPSEDFKNDDWWGMPTSHSEGEDAFCLWAPDYEQDSTIGIIFAYGHEWSDEPPDVQKENPQ